MGGVRTRGVRTAGGLVLLAAAMASAGCGGESYVHFRPAGDFKAAGAGWIAKIAYDLPPESREVKVEVSARGATATNERGVAYERLNVRFSIRNGGAAAFALDPAEVKFLDDEDRQVAGAEAYAGRNRTGAFSIAGGAEGTYELVFDLPGDVQLTRLGSVRVAWPYRYGGKAYQVVTKFIRIEEVNYYYPAYYPYDPGYSDPWYGPYPPPWPHRHFHGGFGYRRGG